MKLPPDVEARCLALVDKRPSSAGALKLPINLIVPCVVRSELNQRCHWSARYRRFKKQGQALGGALLDAGILGRDLLASLPLMITFIRIGIQAMDAEDNLPGAFKGIRDAMAAIIGVDDADERLTWKYDQRHGKAAVEVVIEKS